MVVNGKRYKGGSMSIINGVVYVDGKKYDEEEPKGKVVSATREVVGDSKTFEITGEAEVYVQAGEKFKAVLKMSVYAESDSVFSSLVLSESGIDVTKIKKLKECSVTLTIPNMFERLDLNGSESVKMERVIAPNMVLVLEDIGEKSIVVESTFKSVRGSFGSGDMELRKSTCNSILLSTQSGSILLDECMGNRCELNTMSGDAEIEGGILAEIRAKTMSGDIAVEGEHDCPVMSNTMSGDIKLNGKFAKEVYAKTMSGDITLNCKGSKGALVAESMSGSLRGSGPAVRFSTMSGSNRYKVI